MLRAQQEWKRHVRALGLSANSDTLLKFGDEGIERNKKLRKHRHLGCAVTAIFLCRKSANVALLEKIVDQPAKNPCHPQQPRRERGPQNWALYKEVRNTTKRACASPTT